MTAKHWLDPSLQVQAPDGTLLPMRGTIHFPDVTPTDDPGNDRTIVPSGGASGKTVKAMADADQSLSDADGRKGLVQTTGALTADRKLTFAIPAAAENSYFCPVLNTCSGASIIVTVGTGNNVHIEPGAKALVQISASGVTILVDLPLDPRDFGCPWDGVNDDLPGLLAMLQAIPTTRTRPTQVRLPKGMGYCSGNLRINRVVNIVGHGRAYQAGNAIANGLKFPPLRGVIFDGAYTSSDSLIGSDFAALRYVNIVGKQCIVTDEGANLGTTAFFISAVNDTWANLPAKVTLGTVVVKAGVHIGSIADYISDGGARQTAIDVMFRCTTAGTKGSTEPAAFATAAVSTDLGTTIAANGGGSAVWTVECVPKDFKNKTTYVAGQRVFVPGDNDHIFTCLTGGTSLGWGTTIAAGSNGASLPQATINVADASTFPTAGTARVFTASGAQTVTYTGKSGTTLTGCTGGTGAMATGGAVTQPFNYAPWGIGARVPSSFMASAYREIFYDRVTPITAGSVGAALPQATIHVADTTDFADGPSTIHMLIDGVYTDVAYTGKTATTFTGCTGGTGTMDSTASAGQGILWQQTPAAGVTILANWITIEECAIFGATGNCVWIQANADLSAAPLGGGFAGGSSFWSIRNTMFGFAGSGLTLNSNNANAGESANIPHILLGGGRTQTDAAAYLNLSPRQFGNAGTAVKDRVLGNNKHRNHYIQFSDGIPYRNDLVGTVPAGNYSQWDYVANETALAHNLLYPAVVSGAIDGAGPLSTATMIDGVTSRHIRGMAPSVANPAKALLCDLYPQNANAASIFNVSHTDSGQPFGVGLSDDLAGYPVHWLTVGKANGTSYSDEQLMLFPLPTGAVLWPSGAAVGASMPMWITQDRIWIGKDHTVDPPSIGFGTAAPVAGYFVKGSVVWNTHIAYNAPQGWRCIGTGTPGAWLPMAILATPATVPFTLALQLWFPAPFAGVPWVGQASAGPSAASSLLLLAGSGATAGTAVNGYTPAHLNGTTDSLYVDEAAWADGAGGGSVVVLVKPATTAAVASAGYDEPGIFADDNATMALTFTTSGFSAMQSDAGGRHVVREVAPSAANAWHAVMARWDGSALLGLTVDSVAEHTIACVATTGVSLRKHVGQNFGAVKFGGDILEVLVIDRKITDPEYTAIKAYFNSTYGLSL